MLACMQPILNPSLPTIILGGMANSYCITMAQLLLLMFLFTSTCDKREFPFI